MRNSVSIKFFIIIFINVIFLSCGKSQEEIDYDKEFKNNKKKFYFPKSYDDWWRTYNPNLKDSEGWIKKGCDNLSYDSLKRIKVISQYLNHKGWGEFKGKLEVYRFYENDTVKIDFDCYEPNYKKGIWLNN